MAIGYTQQSDSKFLLLNIALTQAIEYRDIELVPNYELLSN